MLTADEVAEDRILDAARDRAIAAITKDRPVRPDDCDGSIACPVEGHVAVRPDERTVRGHLPLVGDDDRLGEPPSDPEFSPIVLKVSAQLGGVNLTRAEADRIIAIVNSRSTKE